MTILVVGAGATGGYFGARMAQAAVPADALIALDRKARMAMQSVTALADSPEERLVLVIG